MADIFIPMGFLSLFYIYNIPVFVIFAYVSVISKELISLLILMA